MRPHTCYFKIKLRKPCINKNSLSSTVYADTQQKDGQAGVWKQARLSCRNRSNAKKLKCLELTAGRNSTGNTEKVLHPCPWLKLTHLTDILTSQLNRWRRQIKAIVVLPRVSCIVSRLLNVFDREFLPKIARGLDFKHAVFQFSHRKFWYHCKASDDMGKQAFNQHSFDFLNGLVNDRRPCKWVPCWGESALKCKKCEQKQT